MRRDTSSRRLTLKHAGFTLLELMLALGLTITLLTIVYSAMELHWRFSTLGQVEVERAQIARAVLTRMSADVRSVLYQEPGTDSGYADVSSESDSESESDSVESDSSFSDSSDDDTDPTEFEVTDPADAYTGDSVGVFGDGQSLVLHIRRPYRASAASSDDVLNPYSQSDLKSVSWFLAGGEGNLQSLVGTQLQTSKEYDDGIDGLARMTGDRFSLQLADEQGDLTQMASQTKLLAEEINYLAFEYHDGVEWLTEWDSDLKGRVPNAIGVTLGFRPPDYPEGSMLYQEPAESTDTYRLVIPLVIAGAFEGTIY